MDRSTWKQHERNWADRMPTRPGQLTQRIPVTGRHSADVPDIDHSDFAIEVKAGKVVSSMHIVNEGNYYDISRNIEKEVQRMIGRLKYR